jgi:hypothetical protein
MGNQATAYGAAKLHHLETFPRNRILPGRDTVVSADGRTFIRSWTVADRPACKEVTMTVSWRSASRTESLSLAAVIR